MRAFFHAGNLVRHGEKSGVEGIITRKYNEPCGGRGINNDIEKENDEKEKMIMPIMFKAVRTYKTIRDKNVTLQCVFEEV